MPKDKATVVGVEDLPDGGRMYSVRIDSRRTAAEVIRDARRMVEAIAEGERDWLLPEGAKWSPEKDADLVISGGLGVAETLLDAVKGILKSFDENGEYADYRPGGHERLAKAVREARKAVERKP